MQKGTNLLNETVFSTRRDSCLTNNNVYLLLKYQYFDKEDHLELARY